MKVVEEDVIEALLLSFDEEDSVSDTLSTEDDNDEK